MAASITAAAGDSDRSFGTNGFYRTIFPVSGSDMGGSIFQPDGKYIIVGNVFQAVTGIDFYVLRFNADGSSDNTFGTGGRAAIPVTAQPDNAYGVGLQPDGKIIVVGDTTLDGGNKDFAVVRLNENGTPDPTFGTGGVVITSTSTTFEYSTAVAVQSDNKIVVAGNSAGDNGVTMTVVRYTESGVPDQSFDGDGIARIQFPTGLSESNSVKIQSDGKILVSGAAAFGTFTNTGFGFARLNIDGSLDSTFGDGGRAVIDVRTGAAQQSAPSSDVLIQPDGKIVATGYSNSGLATGFDFATVRLNSNGTPDDSFGNAGKVVTPLAGGNDDIARTVILQPDGKLIIGGLAGGAAGGPFAGNALIRYQPNGTLDTQFGNNGILQGRNPDTSGINKIRIIPNGRIFAAGYTRFDATFFIYRTIGSREFDFDGDKKTDISIFRPSVGEWWYSRSLDGQVRAAQFGQSTDKPTPADFTGDGKTDIAFFRPSSGEWFILRSEDGSFLSFTFGQSGDVPLAGDFDADGKADPAVFRSSTGEWFILQSTGGVIITTFGAAGDFPVAGDYDGDSKTDVAIFRPSNGSWWYLRSSDGEFRVFSFGVSTDKPVQADYTGDGKTDIAVWRPATGQWFVMRSENNSFYSVPFGQNGDIPSPGDYDGDGRFDPAVFRPSASTWYVQRSNSGTLIAAFGIVGDAPLPNIYVP